MTNAQYCWFCHEEGFHKSNCVLEIGRKAREKKEHKNKKVLNKGR